MARIIQRARARYEAQEVDFGTVYRWRPESVLVECGCGKETNLTRSETACEGCGSEHAALVRRGLGDRGPQGDEDVRPWRRDDAEHREDASLPF